MVNNPSKNGVCLLPEAEELIEKAYGPGPGLSISKNYQKKRKNHENKDKPHRLCVRLNDTMYEQVNSLLGKMCFATMQDFIEAAIAAMIDKYGGAV